MIITLRNSLPWEIYKIRGQTIKAVRVMDPEGFIYQTADGWVKGHDGQWLVEISDGTRHHLDHEAFVRSYHREEP